MVVFLNGRFVAQEAAQVSVMDRGFLYGDGLFETIRLHEGHPVSWEAHLQRLQRGAAFLRMSSPLTALEMRHAVHRLVALNRLPNSVLRITLSRGPGPRGYSPHGANSPTLVIALHPLPNATKGGVRLITSPLRVPTMDPLSQLKSCSKLLHVVARAEAERQHADDALLINARGHVAEATSSNIFWFSNDRLMTPSARTGALMGITRNTVRQLADSLGISCRELDVTPDSLKRARGVFLTNSVQGIVEATSLDGLKLSRSPLTKRVRDAYESALKAGL